MIRHSQKESLRRALSYLEILHEEFIEEIELKTIAIHNHQARKGYAGRTVSFNHEEKLRMQAWRRTSFALHQRRSRLKAMKDSLARQIDDVRMALKRMETVTIQFDSDDILVCSSMTCEMNYAQV